MESVSPVGKTSVVYMKNHIRLVQTRSTSAPNLHGLDRESTHSTGSMGADSSASGLLSHTTMQHVTHAATHQGPGSESDGEMASFEQAVVKGTDMEVDDTTPFELKALEVVLDYVRGV